MFHSEQEVRAQIGNLEEIIAHASTPYSHNYIDLLWDLRKLRNGLSWMVEKGSEYKSEDS